MGGPTAEAKDVVAVDGNVAAIVAVGVSVRLVPI